MIVVLVLVAVLVVLPLLVFVVTGLAFSASPPTGGLTVPPAGEATHHAVVSGSYALAPQRVVVTDDLGDVTIRAGRAGQVSVGEKLSWANGRPTVTRSLAGGTLAVTGQCPQQAGPGTCQDDLVLTVPAGVAVQIRDGLGDVAVSGITGGASVAASLGDVSLTGLAGPVTVRDSSGDVTGTGLSGSRVSVQAGLGDVRLGFAVAPDEVSAVSNSGDVTITVPAAAGGYQVQAASASGSTDIGVARSAASLRVITVRSGLGDVTVGYPS